MVACDGHVVPSSFRKMPGPPFFLPLQVHGYFDGIGYELPEKANPADFYMDIVAGVVPNKVGQQQTPQARLLLSPFTSGPAADPLQSPGCFTLSLSGRLAADSDQAWQHCSGIHKVCEQTNAPQMHPKNATLD